MNEELKILQEEKIINLIKDRLYTPITVKDMAFLMEVPEKDKEIFNGLIEDLEEQGRLIITKKKKVMAPEKLNLFVGIFNQNPKGFGFVITQGEDEKDTFIPSSGINSAMNKDKVLFKKIISQNKSRQEGEIVKVLERGNNTIVGTFEKGKGFGFVMPDDKRIIKDIFIEKSNFNGAVTGHKVVVEITNLRDGRRNAEGKVIKVIGHVNEPGVDILSVLYQYEIPIEFPEDVINYLENIPEEVEGEIASSRRDLTDTITITIDGEDTKDVDDAVSLQVLPNGNYSLGVHIADVTEYVKENSPLDKEALKRGTSVYLLNKVVPMLPPELSNGICSLNEGVLRNSLSCVMEINKKGEVIAHEIFESVIKVTKRLTYNIVNEVLINENSDYKEEYKDFLPMFFKMEELSKILREKRNNKGAIEFTFKESKIILDEKGKVLEIKASERNAATGIIEEFMLICNETVAEEYFWAQLPFVYRTHEEPDDEKLKTLASCIANFGYTFKGKGDHPKAIQSLLSKVENTPEEMVISKLVLRSLKQARYTHENNGHFGLSSKYYCHFTSPIRRYPDLQIHRIIKENLNKGLAPTRIEHFNKILPEVCKKTSKTERIAEEAEREVDNLKKVEYMSDKIGEVFDGIISGITSWGIYVELPNTIEGMVSINSLEDDNYILNEEKMCFIGVHTKNIYKLGAKVQVELVRANIIEKKLDFIFFQE